MKSVLRTFVWSTLLFAATATISAQRRVGVMGDLIADVTQVEAKIVGLAKAMPDSAFDWRPSDGARSTHEVLLHVAGDNYFASAKLGAAPPAETGITGKAYKETTAYEERKMTRAQVMAALEQSFALLEKSMADTIDDRLEAATEFYGGGRKTTVRSAWLGTTTHLHEHLGQLIAYARSNKVVPPWSR